MPGLPENPPNFLVASDLNHHVTPVAVVPDVVEDLVDDSASEMGAASSQLADERERYIDQLLAEIESLQVIKTRVGDVTMDGFSIGREFPVHFFERKGK